MARPPFALALLALVSSLLVARTARAEPACEDTRPTALMARHPFRAPRCSTDVHPGGPLVGAGVRFDAPSARLRAGYEVGFARYLSVQAALETDAARRAAFVPSLEAATMMNIFFIPSLVGGVGLPLQLRAGETTYAGVRATAGLSSMMSALVFSVDVYPAARRGPVETALTFQVFF